MDVRPVETQRDWKAFFRLRDQLYRDDPAYVRPLRAQERLQIDAERHPFYRRAQRQAFLCWKNGQPVGRIAAILDQRHRDHYQDRTGFFGFFESINDLDVAKALVDSAEAWLAERDCNVIRGPVNPSMKAEFGVLTDGNEHPPYLMTAHTFRYYADLLAKLGFSVIREFYCFTVMSFEERESNQSSWDNIHRVGKQSMEKHPDVRVYNPTPDQLDHELRRVNELGNRVRATNWGFVPLSDEELDHMIRQMKRVVRPEHIILAESNQKLVGFLICIPDVNWALRRARGPWDWLRLPQLLFWLPRTPRVRVLAFGVEPAERQKGIAAMILHRVLDINSKVFRQWEFSWVDKENVRSIRPIQRITKLDIYKKYRLYDRPISQPSE